jgi:hypothetical protein
MGYIDYNNPYRLLSPPIEFYWAGWRADSRRLATEGWEFTIEENPMDWSYYVALRHEAARIKGISAQISHRYLMDRSRIEQSQKPIGPIPVQLASDLKIDPGRVFHPVDMLNTKWESMDTLKTIDPVSIDMFFARQKPTPIDKQILLDQLSMDQVLKLALEKQQPTQERIRKEMLKRKQLKEMLEEGQLPTQLQAELRLVA